VRRHYISITLLFPLEALAMNDLNDSFEIFSGNDFPLKSAVELCVISSFGLYNCFVDASMALRKFIFCVILLRSSKKNL